MNYYTVEGCLIGKTSNQAIQSAIFSTSHTIQSISGCESITIDVRTVAYPECQLQLNVWFIETQTANVIQLDGQSNNITCNPNSHHGTNIDYGTDWCSVTPFEIGYYGIDFGHILPTPRYEMYLPALDVSLDTLSPNDYFIYYNDSYVGPDVSSLNGWNNEVNGWQFGIDTTWTFNHEPEWRNLALWRVDYKCH